VCGIDHGGEHPPHRNMPRFEMAKVPAGVFLRTEFFVAGPPRSNPLASRATISPRLFRSALAR